MTRRSGWWGLLGVVLVLAVVLAAASSRAADLTVDGGATYQVNSNITFNNAYIGNLSTGAMNQSAFSTTLAGLLYLGYSFGSTGTYNLSGGTLSAADQICGYNGNGGFTQSGGSVATGNLNLGLNPGSSGVYNQSGGTNTLGGILFLGNNQGSSGVYNLDGGSLSAVFAIVGHYGLGVFNQSGGAQTISANLQLGYYPGSSGTFYLNGGSLWVVQKEMFGYRGHGVVNQSGGSNTLDKNSGSFFVGYWQGSDGAYNLMGGSLSSSFEGIGYRGLGVFNQSGGNNTLDSQSGDLTVGVWNGSNGAYSLSNGSLASAFETVGYLGLGVFSQSGGSNILSHDLVLGDLFLGNGSYNLSGGSLSSSNTVVGNWGNGTFIQTGGTNTVTNNLTLGQNSGASGAYNLQGGSLSAGTVNVNAGGAFNFTGGSFNSMVLNNSGAIYAGSGCTMNVGSNYLQAAAGNFLPGIGSPTGYGRLNATGTASLNGALTPVLLGYRPQANQVFSGVLSATGGITGVFNLTDPQIGPTLYWQPRYSADRVDLLVKSDYNHPGLGLNQNQAAVGGMLNGLAGTVSGDLGAVLDAVDSLPTGGAVQDAFKQISPEKAGSLATLGFAGATFQMRNLATRTTNLRLGAGNFDQGGGLGSLDLNYSRQGGVMLAYNGAALSNLFSARKEFQAPEGRWGFFADGGAAFGSQKSTLNQTGFDFTLGGFTAGGDYRLRDSLLVGLATGYSHTASGFHGSGGGATANTVPVNAYAAYFPGPLYAYGSLGYALNLFDLERGLSFGGLSRTAKSSPTGHQFNAYGETGYDLRVWRYILTPSATLAYSRLWVGGFTEQDAGALNLQVGSQTADSLQTGLGGRLTVPFKAGQVKVAPQVYAFYEHEFANGSRGLDARLSQGGSAFNFQTDAAKRNFAVVGASLTLGLKENLMLQVDYNAELGRGNYTAHFINAGLRYEF